MNTINATDVENAMTATGWFYDKTLECWFNVDSGTHCAYVDTIGDDCTGISLQHIETQAEKSYEVCDLKLGAFMSEDRTAEELVGFVTYYATEGVL